MLDHFGLLAPFYERVIGPPDPNFWRARLGLPTPGRLLDVGGGTGRVAATLCPLAGQVVLSDVSAGMLREAHAKRCLQAVRGEAEGLPFAAASFARILVVDALHHFADQRRAIGDLLRVLQPGGRLVIEEPDLNLRAVKFLALGEKLALMRSHFYTPEWICAVIHAYGYDPHVERNGRGMIEGLEAWVVVDKPN